MSPPPPTHAVAARRRGVGPSRYSPRTRVDRAQRRGRQIPRRARKALVPNTPIRVMVGMAEGADMLVARAALDRDLGVDAVLPMPLDELRGRLRPGGARASCSDARRPARHARRPRSAGRARRCDTTGARHRPQSLYVALSDTLVRKSNVLITLWNGEFSELPGGTADTVMRYLGAHSGPQPAAPFVRRDDGTAPWDRQIVHWVLVQRANDPRDEVVAWPRAFCPVPAKACCAVTSGCRTSCARSSRSRSLQRGVRCVAGANRTRGAPTH